MQFLVLWRSAVFYPVARKNKVSEQGKVAFLLDKAEDRGKNTFAR